MFAPTQLPLAVVEGLLTVLIMMALENYAKPELKAIGFMKAGNDRAEAAVRKPDSYRQRLIWYRRLFCGVQEAKV